MQGSQRLQKVVFKADSSKKLVSTTGSTVGELLAQLGHERAETEDGFELDKATLLDSLLGAPVTVSSAVPPPVVVAAAPAPPAAVPAPLTPGHLFVSRSDIRYLLSDAWLIPSNGWGSVNRHWVPNDDDGHSGSCPLEIPGRSYIRRVSGKDWPPVTKSSQPLPYACRMPRFQKMDSLNNVATEFVEVALADLANSKTPPRNRRQKYLFSVPLLLTGLGGQRANAGAVVQAVCPHLEQLCVTTGVDIVLVVLDEAIYSMLQTWRRRSSHPSMFSLLSAEDLCKAEELAILGEKGVLSLFIGAGVSVGAGLPTWGTLLEAIAKEASMSKDDISRLWKLPFLDQARLLAQRLGSLTKLREIIVRLVQSDGFSLLHSLLSTLPVDAVTTNYDTLFEKACKAAQSDLVVLPYDEQKGGRFLLKLHGCCKHPDDIVLTREDYLHFDSRRQALGSIVQTTMIRTHMLFVGFSLVDDNYIRLADAVSQVCRTKGNGTALFLFSNAFESDLNNSLHIHAMVPPLAPGESEGPHAPGAARKLEIFVDYLSVMSCSPTHHLLDPAFKSLITTEESEFATALTGLLGSASDRVRATAAFRKLQKFAEVTYGAAKDSTAGLLEAPLLLKPNTTMGKMVSKISQVYMLVNVQVLGVGGMTILKERLAGDDFPNSSLLVRDLFQEGDILEVSGDSYLAQGENNAIGFSYKSGMRKRVHFHFHLHFKVPTDPNAPKVDLSKDRSVCHFFFRGICRSGYNCPLKHTGMVDPTGALQDNNNNNNAPIPPSSPLPPPSPSLAAPASYDQQVGSLQMQMQIEAPHPEGVGEPTPAPMNLDAVLAAENAVEAVAGVVNVVGIDKS